MWTGDFAAGNDLRFSFSSPDKLTVSAADSADHVTIPDAELLFNADFKRLGDDLKLVGADGKSIVVSDYFKAEHLKALTAPDGSALTGDVVSALAGPLNPGHYAQATAPQSDAQAIGRVAKVEGNTSVLRNGITVVLNSGDAVLKGDVVQTGSDGTLGVTFNDGSTFQISPGSRMVLSDFVYDPNGTSNSEVVNIVQGAFTFIAGQVAKTGSMRIGTPVATMGIRGTAGGGTLSNNGQVTLFISDENDNTEHAAAILDSNGNQIGTLTSRQGKLILTSSGQQILQQQFDKTASDRAAELDALNKILQIKSIGDQIIKGIFQQNLDNNKTNPDDHTDIQPRSNSVSGTTFIPSDQAFLKTGINQPLNGFTIVLGGNNGTPNLGFVPFSAPDPQQTGGHTPVAAADSYTTNEDFGLGVGPNGVLINDTDPDGKPLTAHLLTGPQHGTLTLDPNGSFVYVPATNYNGTDSFTYEALNGTSSSGPVTVTLNITPVNDAPVLLLHTTPPLVVGEQTAILVAPSLTLTDVDSATLLSAKVQITGNYHPGEDVLSFTDTAKIHGVFDSATGTLTLTAVAGQSPTDADFEAALRSVTFTDTSDNPSTAERTLTFTVQDPDGTANGGHDTTVATETLKVTPADDAPHAVSDTGNVKAAGVLPGGNIPTLGSPFDSGNVLSNDTDVDAGDTKTVTGVKSGTSAGSVSGDVGSIIVGTYGFLVLQANGSYLYTLNNFDSDTIKLGQGETGHDVFTYTMTDSGGLTSTTTLTIDVAGTNNAPFILDDHTSGAVTEAGYNQAGSATASGTLTKGDFDDDDNSGNDHWSAVAHSGQAQNGATSVLGKYGTFAIDQDGNWTYTLDNTLAATQALNNGDHPTETFNVKVTDSHGASAIETISVRVNGSDDAPTLGNVNAGTLTDTPAYDTFSNLTGALAGSDVDNNAGSLNYAALDPAHSNHATNSAVTGQYGWLTVNSNGSYTYVPNAAAINALQAGDYTDTFTLQVKDPGGATSTATLTVNVKGADDASSVGPVTLASIAEDSGPHVITQAQLLANSSDVDGPSLTVIDLAISSGNGVLVYNDNNHTWTYTPGLNDDTQVAFSYKVTDGHTQVADSATLDITPVNDAPVIDAPGRLKYWTTSSGGNVTAINQIKFADADAGNDSVTVTLTVGNGGGKFTAPDLANDGVGVALSGHPGSSDDTVTLTGSIADINAYIAGNNILYDPPGSSAADRTMTVSINDGDHNGSGGALSATTNVILDSVSFNVGSGSDNLDLHDVDMHGTRTIHMGGGGSGNTLVTSWNHIDGVTTYDGDDTGGSDTVTLVFSPSQLEQILTNSTYESRLQDYLDGNPGSGNNADTLNLAGSDWNAIVSGFETAKVALASGSDYVVYSAIGDTLPALRSNQTGTNGNDTLVASSGHPDLSGGNGNDILVGTAGGSVLQGGADSDLLLGNSGADTLQGGTGNDILWGGAGADIFKFNETVSGAANFGHDIILDFMAGQDSIQFSTSIFATTADVLAHTTQVGHDIVITAGTSDITLKNVALSTLHATDFHLV